MSGDAWPGEETDEVKPPKAVYVEERADRIRKMAAGSASGELQALALLEVSAAIDRLALVLKDGLRDLPPR